MRHPIFNEENSLAPEEKRKFRSMGRDELLSFLFTYDVYIKTINDLWHSEGHYGIDPLNIIDFLNFIADYNRIDVDEHYS